MMPGQTKKKTEKKLSTSVPKYIKIKAVVPLRRVLGLPPVKRRDEQLHAV